MLGEFTKSKSVNSIQEVLRIHSDIDTQSHGNGMACVLSTVTMPFCANSLMIVSSHRKIPNYCWTLILGSNSNSVRCI